MGDGVTAEGIRARARRELTAEIKAEAGRQLAASGPAGLSLRAITRALKMSSSAIYRYFDSRDALLTALVIDAYNDLGRAAESARDQARNEAPAATWRAICRAVRGWALAHRNQYALIYGTPIPGYAAPQETIAPAARVALALADVLVDADRGGRLRIPAEAPSACVRRDAERLMAEIDRSLPPPAIHMLIVAWAGLFGLVSFELFGQFEGVVTTRDEFFDGAADALAAQVGLVT
jgi:AcrR family transcriptional regulator